MLYQLIPANVVLYVRPIPKQRLRHDLELLSHRDRRSQLYLDKASFSCTVWIIISTFISTVFNPPPPPRLDTVDLQMTWLSNPLKAHTNEFWIAHYKMKLHDSSLNVHVSLNWGENIEFNHIQIWRRFWISPQSMVYVPYSKPTSSNCFYIPKRL